MQERRIFVYLSFFAIFLLIILSGVLIFFEKGGVADFKILGQEFSSTNVGLAVLFFAVFIFTFLLREFLKPKNAGTSGREVYTASKEGDAITWDQVINGIHELILQLTSAAGFRPDIIIGICGGGLVVADIISKRLGYLPCLAIWPNRHISEDVSTFGGQAELINQISFDKIFEENAVRRVLIVDDVVYTGSTLEATVEYVSSKCESIKNKKVQIRTATLFALASSKYKPDYYIYTHTKERKMMPVSDRLRA